MRTPIYGVLLLDPSRHSPLELVKSRDAYPVRRDGITQCGGRGTMEVNIGALAQGTRNLQHTQP
jgi:hypothetical protein